MTTDDPNLDAFESALLLRLRARVEQNAATTRARPRSAVAQGSQRAWYATAAAAAAIVALALLIHVVRPEPAFAVTGRNGSKIIVKVARLEGADRLEKALSDRGVDSDIIYLPPGKSCESNRYADRSTPGLGLSISAERFTVTIPPGAIGPGDTFVLSASVTPRPDGVQASVEYGIATGPVSGCTIIDTP